MSSKERTSNPDLDMLRAKLEAHKHSPFPKLSAHRPFPELPVDDPEIVDLHAELWEYDLAIVGRISRVLKGKKGRWGRHSRYPELQKRIELLLQRKPGYAPLLRMYQQNYDELQEMIAIAERVTKRKD